MTFEIRPIDRATFDVIWTPGVRAQLDEIIYSIANWIDDVGDMGWAIDETSQTIFMRVAMANKFDAAECYVLVQQGEFALIRKVKYGAYAIVVNSYGFNQRLDEVRRLANEALLLGGSLMTGNPDPRYSVTKIEYVNFVEYAAPKIGE